MAARSWTERYPHPGTSPALPDEAEELTADRSQQWFLSRYEWNKYVAALRKHEIARAVDDLAKKDVLTPAERIARNVGAMVLDGTLWSTAGNPVLS